MTRRHALRTMLLLMSASMPISASHSHADDDVVTPNVVLPPAKVQIAFNRLYDYPEIVAEFRRLVEAHPQLLSMRSLGKSYEGREMWCITINNPETGADRDKPAMYVDGNIHGNEVQAAEVALYMTWYLTENYDRNPKIKALVDERAFYVIPMVNPDGRAHWFNAPNTTSSSRSGKAPVDLDRDGQADEDGPNDLNGDGQVTQMRRKSPTGGFKLSPEDPRLLVRIGPNDEVPEDQRYEQLGTEGLDSDGDGRVNEDPPGGYDMNRNWPADWQPAHIQNGAGDYPLCWPETQAISDFLLDHPNVAGVAAFHNAAGMFLRGPGSESRQDQHPRGDDRLMETIGATGERLIPFYRNLVTYKDLYSVHGGFTDWTYEHLGIFSFVVELWNNAQMLGQSSGEGSTLQQAVGGSGQAAQLFANDRLLFGSSFVEWEPFDHPTYGPIEIGGFVKQSQRVPPPFLIEEMCHRNTAFLLYHADQMPRIVWGDVTVEPLAGGSYAVTASVRNTRLIPTRSEQAARRRIGLPDEFRIEGDGLTVVAGGELVDRDTGEVRPVESEPARIALEAGVGSRGEVRVRWFVQGSGPAQVIYNGQKAGTLRQEIALETP